MQFSGPGFVVLYAGAKGDKGAVNDVLDQLLKVSVCDDLRCFIASCHSGTVFHTALNCTIASKQTRHRLSSEPIHLLYSNRAQVDASQKPTRGSSEVLFYILMCSCELSRS